MIGRCARPLSAAALQRAPQARRAAMRQARSSITGATPGSTVAYKTIRVDAGEPIVVVRINRPVRNYASKQMAEEIIQFCQQAADRPPETLRAVVLTGEGPVFSCGYNIDELDGMSADVAEEFLTCTYQAIYALYKLPIPLIAAINGPAIGWGFTAAFAADVLTVHPATQLSFSEATLGLLPSATFLLHRKGFSAKARELLFTATRLTGTDAKEIGLVNTLSSDPLGAAMDIAHSISQNAGVPVRQCKRLLVKMEGGTVTDKAALELTTRLGAPLAASWDHKEALRALKRGHLPSFTGV